MTLRRIFAMTFETAEIFTISSGAGAATVQCDRCGSAAVVLGNAETAERLWASICAIAGGVDRERVHTTACESGSIIVCLDSLCQAAPHLPGTSILKIQPSKENRK